MADAAALPGLEQLNGLVRSVTTPEFAGVTFHEVLCKSALNHVPMASASPNATSKACPRRWACGRRRSWFRRPLTRATTRCRAHV